MSSTPVLEMTTLDCDDPQAEARFWSELLEAELVHADESYGLVKADGRRLGFGRVDGYASPAWPDPDGSKQFHLDLSVDGDLDEAAERAVGLGATRPDHQPGDTWLVLLSPAGHPFCLTARANWAQM